LLDPGVEAMSYKGAPLMSVNQTWGTPKEFFTYLKQNFLWIPTLDAAASPSNKKAPMYFTEDMDALKQEWFGNVWLNPPFGKVLLPQFLDKCTEQIRNGNADSIFVLIPARTDTKWFHEKVVQNARWVYLIKGRFNFDSPYAAEGANAPFPSMLVIYKAGQKYLPDCEIRTLEVPKEYRGW
tara:strand:+ start:659 stop:1201 length:543 start_codon:yes stop_codon:yes gene_type:complete